MCVRLEYVGGGHDNRLLSEVHKECVLEVAEKFCWKAFNLIEVGNSVS